MKDKVIFPFLDNGNFQVIYENNDFQIASGNVKGDGNKISIGARWCVSEISKGIKYSGFPYMQGDKGITQCWFIIPNYLAIYILKSIKDMVQDKIYEVLQTLIMQEQERVNRTKDSQ